MLALWQWHNGGPGIRAVKRADAMLLELDPEQVRILRRALEGRVREVQLRLGAEPGDEGFQHELRLSSQLLRQVEALERQFGLSSWVARRGEFEPEDEDS